MMCVVVSRPYRSSVSLLSSSLLVTIVVLLSVKSAIVRSSDSAIVADARALSLNANSNSLASFAAFLFSRLRALSDRSSIELSMR